MKELLRDAKPVALRSIPEKLLLRALQLVSLKLTRSCHLNEKRERAEERFKPTGTGSCAEELDRDG